MTSPSREFASHFGIENIPFGVASSSKHSKPQGVSRFENSVIFLADLEELFDLPAGIFAQPTLNEFAALGRSAHKAVRKALQAAIKDGKLPESSKEDVSDVQMHLPMSIGDYTDFSCSPHHNKRAGQGLFGATTGSLPPAFFNHPLGYAGRCSSIRISGQGIRRPMGQFFENGVAGFLGKEAKTVTYGPCRWLDYEVELGIVIGKPIQYGESVKAENAGDHIFGLVVYNDWSARCIQQLEMIPVGPLNSKNVGTSIGHWIITPDALEPFTIPQRQKEHPTAPYLDYSDKKIYQIATEVLIDGKPMGKANSEVMDWTVEQLVAHQSSAGCGVRTGDFLGWGTISGPSLQELGCLMESMTPGATPPRGYVEDGEVVQIRAYCGNGVGFGECDAEVLPANSTSTWQAK